MNIFKKIIFLLTPKERINAILMFFAILIVAFLEIAGLASIVPFMAILSDPEIIENNSKLNTIYQVSRDFGIENEKQFLIFSGLVVFLLLITSLISKAFAAYLQVNFSARAKFNLEKRLVTSYLSQTYVWFLDRHSAELGKNILGEVGTVIKGGVQTMINLITRGVLAIAVLILLLIVDTKLTLIVSFVIGLTYFIIFSFTRSYLKYIGNERFKANRWRFTTISEAFGAIKEIKLAGFEKDYVDKFSEPANKLVKYEAYFGVLSQLPRFAIEAVAFGGMLLMTLYLMNKSNNFVNIVPTIALYVLAGYRLMPLLQGVFDCINTLRYSKASVDALYNDLNKLQNYNLSSDKKILKLKKEINLNNINFAYPNSTHLNLKHINFKIFAGTSIGIVGITGSGKSTLIDVILGLLKPQNGNLEVDGVKIDNLNRRSWQKSIGYVPQQIFLFDDTIESNIAFSADSQSINQVAIEKAAKAANIHEFIVNELPFKYKTLIGERGIRLSGGQRQRLGIARALYHNPDILIMDEATNALDIHTEKIVTNEIKKLRGNRTMIVITHRLNSVKDCDKILVIEKGEIKQEGKFDELKNLSKYFKFENEKN
jgi:ABC-type bacteriocin/lantibiotic exporter with double-glycine peptidase domain